MGSENLFGSGYAVTTPIFAISFVGLDSSS